MESLNGFHRSRTSIDCSVQMLFCMHVQIVYYYMQLYLLYLYVSPAFGWSNRGTGTGQQGRVVAVVAPPFLHLHPQAARRGWPGHTV